MEFNEQLFRQEIAKKESLNKKLNQLQIQREELERHTEQLKKCIMNRLMLIV